MGGSFDRRPGSKYAGLAFFAIGVACFVLAGLLVYSFSGKIVSGPSETVAGPAPTIDRAGGRKEGPAPAIDGAGPGGGAEPTQGAPWVLYITGEVRSPGVYSLPSGSRVFQLVEAAGGLGPQADPVQVNLASPLADGVHVHVPSLRADSPVSPSVAGGSSGSPPASISFIKDARVNVNTASAAELETIPGVGPVTARAIIDRRETRGPFRSVEDLLDVKGIGPKKLEAMRESVTVR